MKEFDLAKFSSGKFWLTIISGCVFAYVACNKILDSQAVSAILGSVFTSYFMKDSHVQKPN
jgi:hypothetical protein